MKKLTLITELYHTICSECHTLMNEGYVLYGGEQYFCSDECRQKHIPIEDWNELAKDVDSECYWTEWNEEDANYKVENGELIELEN